MAKAPVFGRGFLDFCIKYSWLGETTMPRVSRWLGMGYWVWGLDKVFGAPVCGYLGEIREGRDCLRQRVDGFAATF